MMRHGACALLLLGLVPCALAEPASMRIGRLAPGEEIGGCGTYVYPQGWLALKDAGPDAGRRFQPVFEFEDDAPGSTGPLRVDGVLHVMRFERFTGSRGTTGMIWRDGPMIVLLAYRVTRTQHESVQFTGTLDVSAGRRHARIRVDGETGC